MAYQFSPGDVHYLTSDDGVAALGVADRLALTGRTQLADLTAVRSTAGGHAGAVAETVLLRRTARQRWGEGPWERWLLTDEALQQASPPPVAAHRAPRIARHLAAGRSGGYDAAHDLTCSIGADLAELGAAMFPLGMPVIGSDLDPVRLAMARHNLAVCRVHAHLLQADARTVTTTGTLRYADPARRDAAGRRITSADTIPSVAELDAADPRRPPVLRLPPGIDFDTLDRPGEIEIVSWLGGVREAVSWPAPLAACRRRATILGDDAIREQFTDRDPAEDGVTPARRYLVEPDGAVIRAHLVRQFAARYGLTRLDEHLAYLTGDTPPAGMRAFEIVDVAPFREATVRGWLRRDRVGTLEIKQRGTPVVPDDLRRRLKPSGDTRRSRTLILARVGRTIQAFWCRVCGP
jgi:hypothetical protein